MHITWWDNGQTHLSNRIFKQLRVGIGRLEFGWDTPFRPYIYLHKPWATECCGGRGTDCVHEEMAYQAMEE